MLISVIIPCRNEEKFIEKCIRSVTGFTLPADTELEILVIDGKSDDNTTGIVKDIMQKDSRVRLIINEKKYQVSALNLGIKHSKGEYILRLDAHALYPENYLLLNYETSVTTNADNVGGIIITLPGSDTYDAQIVQALTTHKFGVGNSGFRTGATEGPADTVPYGFFKRSMIDTVGYYNEQLVSGEDWEFNCRLRRSGGKIWLNPLIQVQYFNQPSLFQFYYKQFLREGHYNAYMWYVAPYTFAFRHSIPGVFSFGVIAGGFLSIFSPVLLKIFIGVMILYALLAIISSVQQAFRYKKASFVFSLPLCFFGFHFFYGLGILSGIAKLFLNIAPVKR
ncbi:MAG: glycosyltransferase family 2 protein [Bacteroidales bacterium]|jgi:glycosyltransferase involved in cell wall biosynthesis